jgi:predicted nucleic acid-binding protein
MPLLPPGIELRTMTNFSLAFWSSGRFAKGSSGCGHEMRDKQTLSKTGSKRFSDHLLTLYCQFNQRVAQIWGRFNAHKVLPVVDSLLAATAEAHHLTLVTRNLKDIERTGVARLNPFDSSETS